MDITMRPVGVCHTEFQTIEQMPLQGAGISRATGVIEIFPEYVEGLRDLDGFSHCYLLFYLHKVRGSALTVQPFLDKQPRGVFATRSPKRPNPLGLSIVRITALNGSRLEVAEVDLLDQTPILDIKPYFSAFDHVRSERDGWYSQGLDPRAVCSDDRFLK